MRRAFIGLIGAAAVLCASTAMFLLYTGVVGHRSRQQGLFGGRPLLTDGEAPRPQT